LSDICKKILELKKKHNAVILAHNYQIDEVQDIADFCGDSLGLSVQASKTTADVIVFCGVHFMAETAAILSPQKTVLLPDKHAGCPMADMIDAKQLIELKNKHPNALVVCYVNSTAEVKANSDYCCTSSNAVELVNSLPKDNEIIFVPDQHLGRHVEIKTGRKLILWPGYCPTHVYINEEDIKVLKAAHPKAVVLVHPECSEPVKAIADKILSTSQMIAFVKNDSGREFIIGTEIGIIHSLKKQRPDAQFMRASDRAFCPNMKKITLEKVLWSLEENKYIITVPKDIADKARTSLDRMIKILPST
jgi:quinolinate synthase